LTRKRNIAIGRIDIKPRYAVFEIDSDFVNDLQKAFKNIMIAGIPVKLEIAGPGS
jgi:hypothetical protein